MDFFVVVTFLFVLYMLLVVLLPLFLFVSVCCL